MFEFGQGCTHVCTLNFHVIFNDKRIYHHHTRLFTTMSKILSGFALYTKKTQQEFGFHLFKQKHYQNYNVFVENKYLHS